MLLVVLSQTASKTLNIMHTHSAMLRDTQLVSSNRLGIVKICLLKQVLGVFRQVQAGQHPLQSRHQLPIALGLHLQPVHTKGSGKADPMFLLDVPDIASIWHTV